MSTYKGSVHERAPCRAPLLARQECDTIRSVLFDLIYFYLSNKYPGVSKEELTLRYLWQGSAELSEIQKWIFENHRDKLLIEDIINRLAPHIGSPKKVQLLNLFFIRLSYPYQRYDGRNRIRSQVMSPLHYDNYGDIPGKKITSVWVPLVDTSAETGTFFWTLDDRFHDWYVSNIGISPPTKFHAERNDFDELMLSAKESIIKENCKMGECLFFGDKLLHGSTAAVSKARLTFDFRLLH